MRTKLIYLALTVMLFTSCEEYYKPDLDVVPELLVVDSHVTNDPKQNFVRLSKTRSFYSTSEEGKIIDAKVELIDTSGETTKGNEVTSGYFTFSKLPIPGRKYFIRITHGKDIYESAQVYMPPLPAIDTLYTKHKIEKTYRTDAFGVPEQLELSGREIYIDAPTNPQLKYYRFSWRAVLQWIYSPTEYSEIPPPSVYGWKSFYDNDVFNIAGPKEFSTSDKVQQHPILWRAYNNKEYLDSLTQTGNGWILIIDQYGISKASYDFHEKLNRQLAAEGSLFDPLLTQIYGNIKCVSNPSKIALGFFDLNSYRQHRYFLGLGYSEKSVVTQRRLNQYPDIPDNGYQTENPPPFWINYY